MNTSILSSSGNMTVGLFRLLRSVWIEQTYLRSHHPWWRHREREGGY